MVIRRAIADTTDVKW